MFYWECIWLETVVKSWVGTVLLPRQGSRIQKFEDTVDVLANIWKDQTTNIWPLLHFSQYIHLHNHRSFRSSWQHENYFFILFYPQNVSSLFPVRRTTSLFSVHSSTTTLTFQLAKFKISRCNLGTIKHFSAGALTGSRRRFTELFIQSSLPTPPLWDKVPALVCVGNNGCCLSQISV